MIFAYKMKNANISEFLETGQLILKKLYQLTVIPGKILIQDLYISDFTWK